jgi:hypothetical protein
MEALREVVRPISIAAGLAAIVLALACGGASKPASIGAGGGGRPSPVDTPTPNPTTAAILAALPRPSPGAPDQAGSRIGDCAAIRGTDYQNDAERAWYLANCEGVPAGPPTVTPSPLVIPSSGCRVTVMGLDERPPAGSELEVRARLGCSPSVPQGTTYTADLSGRTFKKSCRGYSDATSEASCVISLAGAPAGGQLKGNACFEYGFRLYCAPLTVTPR